METLNVIMIVTKPGSPDFRDSGWYKPGQAYAMGVDNALLCIDRGEAKIFPQGITVREFNSITPFERKQWLMGMGLGSEKRHAA